MPVQEMDLLAAQSGAQQIGELRSGMKVLASNGKERPKALPTWRITVWSPNVARKVSELYQGEIRQWNSKWEIITEVSSIDVMLPPGGRVFDQALELWTAGGLVRRCTGQQQYQCETAGQECACPHAADPADAEQIQAASRQRAVLAKEGKACALHTRAYLILPQLPDVGVFRLATGSFYGSLWLKQKMTILEAYRAEGVFLPAKARLEPHEMLVRGKKKKVIIPVLEFTDTLQAIATGQVASRSLAQQLAAGAEQLQAITAGAAGQDITADPPVNLSDPELSVSDLGRMMHEATDRGDLKLIGEEIKRRRWETREFFSPAPEPQGNDDEIVDGEVAVGLLEYFRTCWRKLATGDRESSENIPQEASPADADDPGAEMASSSDASPVSQQGSGDRRQTLADVWPEVTPPGGGL